MKALSEIAAAIQAAKSAGEPQIRQLPGYGGIIVLGEIITCPTCQAFQDGYLREPQDGFCPDCGTHVKTRKREQKQRAVRARQYGRRWE